MRAAKNEVYIEGILSEIDLKNGSFTKDGKTNEYISGQIKVRVDLDENNQLEIPVQLYANKITSKGDPNPSYASIERVKNEMISIAASDEDHADRIRLTGSIRMNEYYGRDGRLVSYPRISTGFINKVTRELSPKASFNIQFMIESMGYELDANGDETDTFFVRGIVPYWGDNVDVITFHVSKPSVRDAINQYWENGNCVEAEGRLNFTSTTKTTMVTPDFGEPHEETRTYSISEILITGGRAEPLDETMSWSVTDIQTALAARKERIENSKNSTPASKPAATAKPKIDLGF